MRGSRCGVVEGGATSVRTGAFWRSLASRSCFALQPFHPGLMALPGLFRPLLFLLLRPDFIFGVQRGSTAPAGYDSDRHGCNNRIQYN